MKVLIFGNPNSIYIKKILEDTLIKFHDDVTIIGAEDNTVYADYYRENGVPVVLCKKVKNRGDTLLAAFRNLPVIRKGYDIFCVHYVTSAGLCALLLAKLFCKKTILFFWGSDILRAKQKRTLLRMLSFYITNYIVMGTKELLDGFHEIYGHSFDDKIVKISFGANGLETLEKVEKHFDRTKVRQGYGIDDNKIVVSVGYNNSEGQQHLDVLHAICGLSPEIRQKIHLILRMTYGSRDEVYISRVKQLVDKTGCSSTVFESFLEDEEIAEITMATDMFIHAQITDAHSAAVLEHLYAGCVVLNASWIKYSEFENKMFYLTFDSFEDIKSIIKDNLQPKENSKYKDLLVKNKQAVSELASWDRLVPAWRALYLR